MTHNEPFRLGRTPPPDGWEQPCPNCSAPARCRLRPDTEHHAELRCDHCRHHRWLKKPQPYKDTTMPKLTDMFPSKWLKAADCDEADLILTISELKQESVGQGKDSELKWVMYFEETDKGLVLNKTNTNTIAKLYGDDTDDWEGKKIALYATEVDFQGQTSLGIRVRTRAPKGKGAATAAKAAAPDSDGEDGDDTPF